MDPWEYDSFHNPVSSSATGRCDRLRTIWRASASRSFAKLEATRINGFPPAGV